MDARGKFGEHERSVRVARGYSQTMYEYSVKIQANKFKILALKYTSLPEKSQRLEEEFGLFRIIFTLPKLG